jgi:hypothetical protein
MTEAPVVQCLSRARQVDLAETDPFNGGDLCSTRSHRQRRGRGIPEHVVVSRFYTGTDHAATASPRRSSEMIPPSLVVVPVPFWCSNSLEQHVRAVRTYSVPFGLT